VSSRQVVYAQKRRSTRIDKALALAVQGVGALRAPYHEQVTTLTVSCHGCTYQSKNEVIQGDVVFLDLKQPSGDLSDCSSRARVKWIRKPKTKDQAYEVAVELEVPGNIWGIAPPAEDWFPIQQAKMVEPSNSGRELRVVARTEPQASATPIGGSAPASHLERSETAASLSPLLAQLMAGLGEQIQVMAAAAITANLAEEKNRLIDEFRAQLHDEATKALARVIANSKEELAPRVLKELNEAHEAVARTTYERCIKKFELDMESASQRLEIQGKEVSQHLDSMAAGTIERVQRNMEASRSEAVDRFVSRLRDQVTPLLEEAKAALQKLAVSQATFKEESMVICARFQEQLDIDINARLAKAHEDLDRNSAAVVDETAEKLLKLSQGSEKTALDNLRSLVASAADYTKKSLEEKTSEISRHFSTQLESYTRSYLESISESIAEIPKKTAVRSND
jgi:hypothetical protein